MSGPNLTPGDPLGGGGAGGARPAPPADPAPRPLADPPPPTTGYTSERPPGADRLGPAAPSHQAPATLGPELVLAGWWRRVGAQVVDGFLIGLIALLVLVPFGIGAFGADTDEGSIVAVITGVILSGLVYVLITLIYAPLMMLKTNGQTLGRMATGIRVVKANGAPMELGTAVAREVILKTLLINVVASSFTLGLATLLDVLWPLWDEENRALHDFPVNTRTVLA